MDHFPPGLRFRLSLFHFLQFFSLGTATPVFTVFFIQTLTFDSAQSGWIMAVGAAASTGAPLVGAYLLHKKIAERNLFFLFNVVAGAGLTFLLLFRDFWLVLAFYSVFMFFKSPTFGLTNSITFSYLTNRERGFPKIRVWGTFGFIASGLVALIYQAFAGSELSWTYALALSAAFCFVAGFYALTLPRAHASKPVEEIGSPASGSRLRLGPFLVVAFLVSTIDRFYFFGAALFLKQAGVETSWVLPLMTLGQFTEMVVMTQMRRLYKRWGFRTFFLMGIAMQAVRFAVLAGSGVAFPLVLLGLSLHGVAFSFFFVNAYVFVDSVSAPSERAKHQQHLMFLVEGLGVVAGNLLAGWTGQVFTDSAGIVRFDGYWAVPAALAVAVVVVFAVSTRGKKDPPIA